MHTDTITEALSRAAALVRDFPGALVVTDHTGALYYATNESSPALVRDFVCDHLGANQSAVLVEHGPASRAFPFTVWHRGDAAGLPCVMGAMLPSQREAFTLAQQHASRQTEPADPLAAFRARMMAKARPGTCHTTDE